MTTDYYEFCIKQMAEGKCPDQDGKVPKGGAYLLAQSACIAPGKR